MSAAMRMVKRAPPANRCRDRLRGASASASCSPVFGAAWRCALSPPAASSASICTATLDRGISTASTASPSAPFVWFHLSPVLSIVVRLFLFYRRPSSAPRRSTRRTVQALDLLDQLAQTRRHRRRQRRPQPDQQIAMSAALQPGQALAGEAKYPAILRLRRHLEGDAPIQRRHLDIAAQNNAGKRRIDVCIDVVFVTRKGGMRTNMDHEEQIAFIPTVQAGITLASDSDP